MAEDVLEDLWLLFAMCSQYVDGEPVPMLFTDQDKRTDWVNSHIRKSVGHMVTIWDAAATVLYEEAKRNRA